jgi:integrase
VAELFKRPGSDKHQAYCWYWAGNARRRIAKSTGIRDDGSAKSRQTAQIIADQIERGLALGGESQTCKPKTLAQALRALAEASELAGLAPVTLRAMRERSMALAEHFDMDRPIADIDADKVIEYAIWSRSMRSAATVDRELNVLERAFKSVHLKPPALPDLGSTKAKPQRVLEVDEQRAFLLAMPADRKLHALAYLQLGVRKSELWKIADWDWQGRYVHVHGTKTPGSKRWVPMPAELFEALYPLRASWSGFEPWDPSAQNRTIRAAGKRAGICEDLHPNDLRGTYATHMARADVSPLKLASYMGTSVEMLQHVYAQVKLRGDHHHADVSRGVPRLRCSSSAAETTDAAASAGASGAPNTVVRLRTD